MTLNNVLIKDDKAAELARLSATNFFIDKPADMTQAVYLYHVAKREAARWGAENYLAAHYFRMSAYARTVGA
jgi:hypothetical protein